MAEREVRKTKRKRENVVFFIVVYNPTFYSWLLTYFEASDISIIDRSNTFRWKHSSCQLNSLVKKTNSVRRTVLLYRQRLEKRCSDLQMAEAEVDLLGDEVDTLLRLLEKIYIGLDHYLPVLQHYPGIIEILKLIRKELWGDSAKPVK
ncbi:hypothetical protein H5410_005666 [Solanum commersonii]|uniref:Uncharacterized protein n=1 Tax=Solanum commersonii TaxID=4109 RepID=A0A9J6A7S1_SOLCO|nr:hypothetical protein H5410_005666 [Solanum commersonii]